MKFIEFFKKQWGILSGAGLFIVAVIGTFLIDPPPYVIGDKIFSNWGKFVAAIIVGLVLVGVILFRKRHHTRPWLITTVSMLVLSVGTFFSYQYLLQSWTCACFNDNEIFMIGRELRNPDNEFVAQNREDCRRLLQGAACNVDKVWTKRSTDANRLVLASVYTLSLPLLITSMMGVIQAIYCAQRRA